MNYAIYEIATGRIVQISTTPKAQEVERILQAGQDYVLVPSSTYGPTEYIHNGRLATRPEMPTDLNGLTLTDVPVPCLVYINREAYMTEDSTVELEFDQPGTYNIRLECWPYLDKEFTVEA